MVLVDQDTNPRQIGADDFARRFALRAANLMWLLGAGASASAGIPTAGDMVWEFKQRLYTADTKQWDVMVSYRHATHKPAKHYSAP